MPRSLRTVSELAWRFLVCFAAVALIAWILWQVRLVALPAFIAVLLATALVPPVRSLMRRGWPAGLATGMVFFGSLAIVVGIAALIVPPTITEVEALVDQVRGGATELGRLLASQPFGITQAEIERAINRAVHRLADNSGALASGVVNGAAIAGQAFAGMLLTLVLLFFFVRDGERLWGWFVRQFPLHARDRVDQVGNVSWQILRSYVRGVATVAVVDGVFIGLGLLILDVPLVLPLAMLTFLAAFFPLIGAVAAGIAAALVALVANGLATAIAVVVVVLVVQQLEGNLLYPMLVGRTMDLHPVVTLLVVGGGAVVAGIIGALVALPMTAVIAAAIPILRGKGPPAAFTPADEH